VIIKRANESVDISIGTAHRVENPGDELLVFIGV
jgi:mannose-6-phosphate isomerase-like protein (cupin superfamily)